MYFEVELVSRTGRKERNFMGSSREEKELVDCSLFYKGRMTWPFDTFSRITKTKKEKKGKREGKRENHRAAQTK